MYKIDRKLIRWKYLEYMTISRFIHGVFLIPRLDIRSKIMAFTELTSAFDQLLLLLRILFVYASTLYKKIRNRK